MKILNGKYFGSNCYSTIKNLLSLREENNHLKYLCKNNVCSSCPFSFNCPVESFVKSNHHYPTMF